MRSPSTRFAIAAVVCIAALLGLYALTGSIDGTSVTMAQVRQAMQEVDWMQIINTGEQGTEIGWFSFDSKVHIEIGHNGRIVYSDFQTGRQLHWPPGSDSIHESRIGENRQFAYGAEGPFEMIDSSFRMLEAERDGVTIKETGTQEDRKVEIWTVTHKARSGGRRLRVCFDPERMLPISATFDHVREDGTVHRESNIEFKYPVEGPADVYEAGAPRSAEIRPAEPQPTQDVEPDGSAQ